MRKLLALFLIAALPVFAATTENGVDIGDGDGFISINNSSTGTNVASGVFTGPSDVVSGFATISVFLDTDVGGTLSMQFSTDDTNWDRAKVIEVPASGGEKPHTLTVISKHFRIVYTNGSVAQGHFRLQTIYHKSAPRELTSTSSQNVDKRDDVTLVRPGNDFYLDVARGIVTDASVYHLFGRNSDVGTTLEDVWTIGALYTWQTNAFTIEAISTDAADTAAGAGARTICGPTKRKSSP
jgi:hypothetical protein